MKSSHTPFPLDQPCLVALSVSIDVRRAKIADNGRIGEEIPA